MLKKVEECFLKNGMKEAKMIKRGLLILACVFALLVLSGSSSSAQQPPKIAAVDLQRAFESSAEGKAVLNQLRLKEQSIIGELDKFDSQILSLETKLRTQGLTLTEEAQHKLDFELGTAKLQRKRVEEDSTKGFQRLQFTLISKLRNEVLAVIEGYAKEQQISLVFDLSAPSPALYCEPGLDITAEIVRRYDASKRTK
jgi:Skp family chaperone for outer membrane proteins